MSNRTNFTIDYRDTIETNYRLIIERISQYNPILRPVYCLQYFVSQSFHTQIIVLSPYIDVFVIKII